MDDHIPTAQELELELKLRERDLQIIDLTNDIKALRAYLPKTIITDPNQKFEIPYSILSILAPLAVRNPLPQSNVASASITAALKARVATLQQENDELYTMMGSSVVSKLDEEVKMLRYTVTKLESALQDSHKIIGSLSSELDAAFKTISAGLPDFSSRHIPHSHSPIISRSHSRSPSHPTSPPPSHSRSHSHSRSRSPSRTGGQTTSASSSSTIKPIPTAPRALKRPRPDVPDEREKLIPTGPRPRGPRDDRDDSRNRSRDRRRDGSSRSHHGRQRSDRDRSRSPHHHHPRERIRDGRDRDGLPPPSAVSRARGGIGRKSGGGSTSGLGKDRERDRSSGIGGDGRSLAQRIR